MTARFIQVHTLASYPAVLLNRDDAGLAKRLPYGGSSRIRVSSQCLKRHWRTAKDEWALAGIGAPMAVRSREVVERMIMPKIAGAAEDVAEAIRVALVKKLFGDKSVEVKNRQALLLGQPEIDYLAKLGAQAAAAGGVKQAENVIEAAIGKGTGKKNLAAMRDGATLAAGLESALFGRMVTSDPEANTDAAIHVAHAFTVHAEESESDYFTVVDDLRQADPSEAGTAGIFETELTSGLFYGYVVIDVPALVSNLAGDHALAARVVEHLLHLIATVSPGAKKGSTAPYAYAELMLVEAGKRQPRSLAGAFRTAVDLKSNDLLGSATTRIAEQLRQFDGAYGQAERRAALCTTDLDLPGIAHTTPLDDLAAWAAAAVREAG
jgi:CRISPR system Cascade subunit CasC